MYTKSFFLILIIILINVPGCKNSSENEKDATNIIYLHHSTGKIVWQGKESTIKKLVPERFEKYIPELTKPAIVKYLKDYNKENGTSYQITAREFPAKSPYGWKNYPYDYYNIWVKHGNQDFYKEEPTMNILTEKYDVVVFKHCFPVSHMIKDSLPNNPASEAKSLGNYKVQYQLLKEKMNSYPNTRFLLWTGPALLEKHTNKSEAAITNEFYEWVKNEWDAPDDNIFLWDFRELETEGGLFLKTEFARNSNDSHPNIEFGERAAELFVQRLIDVIRNNGIKTDLTGKIK